jgi:hypothetical protein
MMLHHDIIFALVDKDKTTVNFINQGLLMIVEKITTPEKYQLLKQMFEVVEGM